MYWKEPLLDPPKPLSVVFVAFSMHSSCNVWSLCNRWINEELLKEELTGTRGISRRTVHKWMQKLGFRWSRHHKCMYVDGRNRPDIVTNRWSFVALLKCLRQKMSM